MSLVSSPVIAPSLLAADFGHLASAASDCHAGGAEYLHFDVMDGRFVPNITMGPTAVRALRPVSKAVFDVHLMIVEPEKYLHDFLEAGADSITVQLEACIHLQRNLAQIRAGGAKAGVAINPATPPELLEYVLDDIDLVLVMTVNPGFGGQPFLPATLPKIEKVREMVRPLSHPVHIQVDGGIDSSTAARAAGAGATNFVAGTSIFKHPDGVGAGIRAIRASASGAV